MSLWEIYILPARVSFEISKSSTLTHPFDNMYSSTSLMKHFLLWLFPVSDAATTIQNKFRHEGVVRKWPRVFSPIQLATNGNAVPIANQLERLSVPPPNSGILVHLEEEFSASYILYYMLLHIIFR